jgi:hypothetical protein
MSRQGLRVIQIAPLYYRTDEPANTVFGQHQDTFQAIFKDSNVILVVVEPFQSPNPTAIARAPNHPRFPGLEHSDIPCLWVEAADAHFTFPLLGKSTADIDYALKVIRSTARKARTLSEIQAAMSKKQPPNLPQYWRQNLITLLIILAVMLLSFIVLDLNAALAFSLVIVVLAPVIMAFAQGAQTIQNEDLLKLYSIGLDQVVETVKAVSKLLKEHLERRNTAEKRKIE